MSLFLFSVDGATDSQVVTVCDDRIVQVTYLAVWCDWCECVVNRNEDVETVELSELTVNPGEPKTGPQDFELLKLLGKGGYGKVGYLFFHCIIIL